MSSQGKAAPIYRVGRRGLFGAGLLLLARCGWQPVYATRSDGTAGPAEQGLAAISVGLMPERLGQLVRQALQTRLDRAGSGVAKLYDLTAQLGLSAETLNIEQATSIPSRLRLVGTANWSLVSRDVQRKTLASGTARVMDGFNLYDQQYFAADMQTEAVHRRIAGAIADQITLQLATWFNRHAAID